MRFLLVLLLVVTALLGWQLIRAQTTNKTESPTHSSVIFLEPQKAHPSKITLPATPADENFSAPVSPPYPGK